MSELSVSPRILSEKGLLDLGRSVEQRSDSELVETLYQIGMGQISSSPRLAEPLTGWDVDVGHTGTQSILIQELAESRPIVDRNPGEEVTAV